MCSMPAENIDVAAPLEVEAIPPKVGPLRNDKGQFLPGCRGGGGRPKTPEELKQAFRALTPYALEALYDIIQNGKNTDRVKAAEVILDRAWGKAPQTVTDTNGNTLQGVLVLPAIELPSIEKSR